MKENNAWYYYSNNTKVTGWKNDKGYWYYLHKNGDMATGWTKVNGKWYFLSQNGIMHTGWYFDGVNWFYLHQDGSMATGWTKVDGKWYLLSQNGTMRTGWYSDGTNWFYLHQNGSMATGWTKVEGKWYFLSQNGTMRTGWYSDGTNWFYLHQSGSMATGWTKVDGKWYLLSQNGTMRTGWYFDGTNWYYLHSGGNMATGWIQDNGKWYYLYEDGVMKKESVYLDAPMIFQLPELHNGCEVVSMTMMLKYHGHNVDKLTLAKQLPVDSTPMVKGAGSILIWGDPSVGFVGDVKGISPGYSIDPAPLKKVLDRYTNSGINLTGSDFSKIERLVAQGKPVVTWITASFSHPVAPKTWKTPSGKTIQADFDMHAVLVTGYDNDYVYINDPLRRGKGAKIPKQKFISSYNYMEKKALSM
ncbi:C39 family peptidase [Bacillus cereus]|uniref:C39 family peptidase n=1 Tax=Bacillus cereus TaxID=1396 RepID=UPI0032049C21